MNRCAKIVCLFVVLLCYAFCTISLAEEENVGFMKRMWRRIYRGQEKTGTTGEEKMREAVKEETVEPAGETGLGPKPKMEARVEPEPTREEMIQLISKYLADYGDEISARMANIVKKVDADGKISFLFKMPNGEEVAFKDLDGETLLGVYRRISNQAVLIRQEILQLRLQQLRRLEQMQRQERLTHPPQSPVPHQQPVVQPPQVPNAPMPPGGAQIPPSPPSIPGQRR